MIRLCLIACLLAAAPMPDAAQTVPAKRKTPAELERDAVWQGLYHASVHVRYHEAEAASNASRDFWLRWLGILLSVTVFAGPLVFTFSEKSPYKQYLRWGWGLLGTVCLCASIVSTFAPFSATATEHRVLARRWLVLRYEWERLYRERDELDREQLQSRLAQLESQQLEIEKAEPFEPPDRNLERAQDAEDRFRGQLTAR